MAFSNRSAQLRNLMLVNPGGTGHESTIHSTGQSLNEAWLSLYCIELGCCEDTSARKSPAYTTDQNSLIQVKVT